MTMLPIGKLRNYKQGYLNKVTFGLKVQDLGVIVIILKWWTLKKGNFNFHLLQVKL